MLAFSSLDAAVSADVFDVGACAGVWRWRRVAEEVVKVLDEAWVSVQPYASNYWH